MLMVNSEHFGDLYFLLQNLVSINRYKGDVPFSLLSERNDQKFQIHSTFLHEKKKVIKKLLTYVIQTLFIVTI